MAASECWFLLPAASSRQSRSMCGGYAGGCLDLLSRRFGGWPALSSIDESGLKLPRSKFVPEAAGPRETRAGVQMTADGARLPGADQL